MHRGTRLFDGRTRPAGFRSMIGDALQRMHLLLAQSRCKTIERVREIIVLPRPIEQVVLQSAGRREPIGRNAHGDAGARRPSSFELLARQFEELVCAATGSAEPDAQMRRCFCAMLQSDGEFLYAYV